MTVDWLFDEELTLTPDPRNKTSYPKFIGYGPADVAPEVAAKLAAMGIMPSGQRVDVWLRSGTGTCLTVQFDREDNGGAPLVLMNEGSSVCQYDPQFDQDEVTGAYVPAGSTGDPALKKIWLAWKLAD